MSLERLQVSNIRLLRSVTLQFSPGLNLIYGPNASGKTSLLEAIDILSRGRSFRSRLSQDLISKGEDKLLVSGKLINQHKATHQIGIEKSRSGTRLRVDGETAHSMSALTSLLPIQIIHPESHQLITGSPIIRRAFMDWGVFHVKHQYLEHWRRYQRTLQQRNKALRSRSGGRFMEAWHHEMAQSAAVIDGLRADYISRLKDQIEHYAGLLLDNLRVSVDYRRGWPPEAELDAVLDAALHKDMQRGFTSLGPQRAELKIRLADQPAAATASRGQQKALVAVLRLAQADFLKQQAGLEGIFMVDDLPSELDAEHRYKLLGALQRLGIQVIATAIEPGSLVLDGWSETRMFHVKQGRIEAAG